MSQVYAAARPLVTIQDPNGEGKKQTTLPAVFLSPIRSDIVRFVHTNIAKNRRQAYAVHRDAGHQTAAVSWGTGRAVSRIPRVPGSGTHRAGQGAFGNMCRGGRMFAPTRQWRKWHRRVNRNQRRYAVASALAATALPALVMARGHRISQVAEVPFVVADSAINGIKKTKDAQKLLEALGAYSDVEKVSASKKIHRGRGKMRNRRYTKRRGPLVVHDGAQPLVKAFRNLPGVEFSDVSRLNLLTLAPGGHLGRFVIWTEGAFAKLDVIYGNGKRASTKKGFALPAPLLSNADIARTINSDAVQSALNAPRRGSHRAAHKKNPLKNLGVMQKLNPHHRTVLRKRLVAEKEGAKAKEAAKSVKTTRNPRDRKRRKTPYNKMINNLE